MKNGVYAVRFTGTQMHGAGVVVIHNNKFHGGDHGYWYRGTFIVEGDSVKCKLHAENHTDQVQSVFGGNKEFDLDLEGTAEECRFTVTGSVAGHPNRTIQITASFVSDLL